MRFQTRRVTALALALALTLVMLAGCSVSGDTQEPADTTPSDTGGSQPSGPAGSDGPSDVPDDSPDAGNTGGFVEVSLPLTDETVVLTYWDRMAPYLMAYDLSYEEFLYFKELGARTNVKLEFTVAPFFTAKEQFNIMINSGEYPDLVNGFFGIYTYGIDTAVDEGLVYDLAQHLDLMPNYAASLELKDQFKIDSFSDTGKLGAANLLWVETEGVSAGGYIRKDWLDAVGLGVPTTFDEFETVFEAFKTELGKTGAYGLTPTGIDSGMFMAAGYNTAGFYNDEAAKHPFLTIDGTVEFGPTNQGYRQYLEMMSRWYDEGYIHPDYLSWTSGGIPIAEQLSGVIGFAVTERDRMQSIMEQSEEPGVEVVGVPWPSENKGGAVHYRTAEFVVSSGVAVTTGCSNLELALSLLNYMYSDEGTLLANYGVQGETFEYDDDGNPQLTDLVVKNPDYNLTVSAVVYTKFGGPMRSYNSRLMKHFKPYVLEANDEWLKADEEYVFPLNASMSSSDLGEYSAIMSEVKTYCQEFTNQVIIGSIALTDDTWNSYVSTVESLNIARALELKQASYEAYIGRA